MLIETDVNIIRNPRVTVDASYYIGRAYKDNLVPATGALTRVISGGGPPGIPYYIRYRTTENSNRINLQYQDQSNYNNGIFINVDSNGTYTISMLVRTSLADAQVDIHFEYFSIDSAEYNPDPVVWIKDMKANRKIPAGAWTQLVWVIDFSFADVIRLNNKPPIADLMRISPILYGKNWDGVTNPSTNDIPSNTTFEWTALLMVKNDNPENKIYGGTFFDGSYTSVGNVQYAWEGTPNASNSIQRTYVEETQIPNAIAELRVLEEDVVT